MDIIYKIDALLTSLEYVKGFATTKNFYTYTNITDFEISYLNENINWYITSQKSRFILE